MYREREREIVSYVETKRDCFLVHKPKEHLKMYTFLFFQNLCKLFPWFIKQTVDGMGCTMMDRGTPAGRLCPIW